MPIWWIYSSVSPWRASLQQAFRAHVEKQLARQFQLGEALQYHLAAQVLDLHRQPAGARHLEQVHRRMQRAVGRPAYQTLVGDDVAVAHIDNRLEQRAELSAREYIV